jgi:hypothetical protein
VIGWALATSTSVAQSPPPDGTWTTDAVVEVTRAVTDMDLGAVQGIVVRDGKIYAYGDVVFAKPRVGVIKEYELDLKPTGRSVRLTRSGQPLIIHPTGLTWDARWGTFLGDTISRTRKSTIYRLDWGRALTDGNLDRAVLATIDDDAAVNGCRPLFVRLGGRTLLASADYGDIRPELRLHDPEALLAAGRTSAPGVVVHRVLCGPWNQNLYWDEGTGRLTCVQNVIEGRGWRLDEIDLAKAVADGRATGPGVRLKTLTFPSHDELEGFWPLDKRQMLFVAARRHDNVVVGVIQPSPPRESPPGTP